MKTKIYGNKLTHIIRVSDQKQCWTIFNEPLGQCHKTESRVKQNATNHLNELANNFNDYFISIGEILLVLPKVPHYTVSVITPLRQAGFGPQRRPRKHNADYKQLYCCSKMITN